MARVYAGFGSRFALSLFQLSATGGHDHAEIRSNVRYEKCRKRGTKVASSVEGKMPNLSIEMKVAIAVAAGLAMLIVGAMAQG